MRRATMDWRKLLMGMALRFFAILRKEHAEVSSDNASYIFDDTTLEKTGYGMEQISRVFDHVQNVSLDSNCYNSGLREEIL